MSGPIRLAPEWQCWPTWDDRTGDNLDPATLGLPPDLVARLVAWDDSFQASFNPDEPLASAFPSPQAEEDWRRESRALAAALRAHGLEIVDHRQVK